MNAYLKELKRKKDEGFFDNPVSFGYLQRVAELSSTLKITSTNISSILIFHQLVEVLIKILINQSIFYMQLKIYPLQYEKRLSDELMFGQVIKELNSTIDFPNRKKIIALSQKLNKIRIKVVHKLTTMEEIQKSKEYCEEAKILYTEIWELFDESFKWFNKKYRNLKRKV